MKKGPKFNACSKLLHLCAVHTRTSSDFLEGTWSPSHASCVMLHQAFQMRSKAGLPLSFFPVTLTLGSPNYQDTGHCHHPPKISLSHLAICLSLAHLLHTLLTGDRGRETHALSATELQPGSMRFFKLWIGLGKKDT